jgi:hypothetical protein
MAAGTDLLDDPRSFADFAAAALVVEVDLNWRLLSATHAIAAFDAGIAVTVEVSFERREPDGPWHAGFRVISRNPAESTIKAFRIFNGVLQAVREFIETRQPELLIITAKDPDLADVYAAYLRRESERIVQLGYAIDGPVRVDPYTEFILRRIRPSS